jgi:hypothetical protein
MQTTLPTPTPTQVRLTIEALDALWHVHRHLATRLVHDTFDANAHELVRLVELNPSLWDRAVGSPSRPSVLVTDENAREMWADEPTRNAFEAIVRRVTDDWTTGPDGAYSFARMLVATDALRNGPLLDAEGDRARNLFYSRPAETRVAILAEILVVGW